MNIRQAGLLQRLRFVLDLADCVGKQDVVFTQDGLRFRLAATKKGLRLLLLKPGDTILIDCAKEKGARNSRVFVDWENVAKSDVELYRAVMSTAAKLLKHRIVEEFKNCG